MKKQHSLDILFEDQWIVVVSKPAGMLSVGFPGSRGKTAEDILADMNRSRGKVRVSAVHRLDRDTSGVMMFALSVEAKKRIMDDWQDMVSERVYRAVCERPTANERSVPGARAKGSSRADTALPDSGTIDAPLAYNRNDVAYVPRKGDFKAMKDAEKAVTHYHVIERGSRYDLVECSLETGRKNQIRAHMAHLGHPVAGDDVYGTAASRDLTSGDGHGESDRLCLHARVLAFTHPYTGEQHRFEVPEPESFIKLVRTVKSTRANGASTATSGSDDGAERVPRRQRGKAPRAKNDDDVKNIEDLKDLKPVPRKSRTRQDIGKSRFIPGK